jgi:hypothetical protein
MRERWRQLGPKSGRRWPATYASAAAAIGAGSALGGLPHPFLIALGSTAAALAAFSFWWSTTQRLEARRRGTVYVVRERASTWADDERPAQAFIASLAGAFPDVRPVPGPAALRDWDWPLGSDARSWDIHVGELVSAVRIVRRGDVGDGAKSLVAWVPWPVAVAMMARLLAAERGFDVAIRQRSSYGRAEPVENVDPRQPALAFRPSVAAATATSADPKQVQGRGTRELAASGLVAGQMVHDATLTVTRRQGMRGGRRITRANVTVLVLRMLPAAWGPLPTPGEESASSSSLLRLAIADSCGIGFDGSTHVTVLEWRCLPGPGQSGAHRWHDYEDLARSAVGWIAGLALTASADVVLLGALMPQEVGLGMGMILRRLDPLGWPTHLYPLVLDGSTGGFVIPGLDLGRDPVSEVSARPLTR